MRSKDYKEYYKSFGGIDRAVGSYLNEELKLAEIAAMIGVSRQSVHNHFVRYLGENAGPVRRRFREDSKYLSFEAAVDLCTSAERQFTCAKHSAALLLSLENRLVDFRFSISKLFSRVHAFNDHANITIRTSSASSTPGRPLSKTEVPSGHYVKFDITRKIRNYDGAIFGAVGRDGQPHWYGFRKKDLPEVKTVQLKLGLPADGSAYFKYYRSWPL